MKEKLRKLGTEIYTGLVSVMGGSVPSMVAGLTDTSMPFPPVVWMSGIYTMHKMAENNGLDGITGVDDDLGVEYHPQVDKLGLIGTAGRTCLPALVTAGIAQAHGANPYVAGAAGVAAAMAVENGYQFIKEKINSIVR